MLKRYTLLLPVIHDIVPAELQLSDSDNEDVDACLIKLKQLEILTK
jgi:hypothetical protein